MKVKHELLYKTTVRTFDLTIFIHNCSDEQYSKFYDIMSDFFTELKKCNQCDTIKSHYKHEYVKNDTKLVGCIIIDIAAIQDKFDYIRYKINDVIKMKEFDDTYIGYSTKENTSETIKDVSPPIWS